MKTRISNHLVTCFIMPLQILVGLSAACADEVVPEPSLVAPTLSPTVAPLLNESILVLMKDARGSSVGTARLTQKTDKRVSVEFNLNHLPVGIHAIHLHAKASCMRPAGGDLSPDRHHGNLFLDLPDTDEHPNIQVTANGTLIKAIDLDLGDIGANLRSLQKGAGSALVIRAAEDDEKTLAVGNASERIACGEIRPVAQ